MGVVNESAARCVVEVIPRVMRTLAQEFRSTGYPPAPVHCVLLVSLAEGPHNLTELAEKLAVSLPTMSNSINTLVERGWVSRSRAAEDRRMVVVELTPEGQAILDKTTCSVAGRVGELLASLSPEECEMLLSGLEILDGCFSRTAECSQLPARQAGRCGQNQNRAVAQGDLCPPTIDETVERGS
jgi:DNA-binding MarR family transcriptional regulator